MVNIKCTYVTCFYNGVFLNERESRCKHDPYDVITCELWERRKKFPRYIYSLNAFLKIIFM